MPGTNRDNDAAKKLPQLVNFAVYPTTIILGRDGRVRTVHAGFASRLESESAIERARRVEVVHGMNDVVETPGQGGLGARLIEPTKRPSAAASCS